MMCLKDVRKMFLKWKHLSQAFDTKVNLRSTCIDIFGSRTNI